MDAGIFTNKNLLPMLLHESEPFDSGDFIFELKLDGFRCIAYLNKETVLKSRNNNDITPMFPELNGMHKNVKLPCIIDGEITVLVDGRPDFSEIQKRSRLKNVFSVNTLAKNSPAVFTAFDILYLDGKFTNSLPLTERKILLENIITESGFLSISRYIEEFGVEFFNLVKEQQLEGIVAKKKDSKYYFGKRTKEWLKIKAFKEEDVVVCGFYSNKNGYNLILGFLENGLLKDAGTAGIVNSNPDAEIILNFAKNNMLAEPLFLGYKQENITWLKPELKGTIQFLSGTKAGHLRHPIFKGLKIDS